jgi:hypothetical protein
VEPDEERQLSEQHHLSKKKVAVDYIDVAKAG